LPVTRKSQLKELQDAEPPFGGLTVTPLAGLARIFMSPGPIFDPEGHAEDYWRFARPLFAAGVRRGQTIQNCFSYHFTPAAFMVDGAARRLGCPIIPAGTGNAEMQVQAMLALRPESYVGTPSFLKIILEKAAELGTPVRVLARAIVGAEALPPSLRKALVALGVPVVTQMYGSADLGNIAYETHSEGDVHPGMVIDEAVLVEIVRPGTGEPVPAGDVGEVVVTSFNSDYPLIRFATGDLSAILEGPSPCGRTNQRIKGWMGRADQTTKVRAMFVHPGQVAEIVRRHAEIGRARLIVTGSVGSDTMTLHCEVDAPAEFSADAARVRALEESIRDVTKLRGAVLFVARGSLPNDGKVISDERVNT
jgi:phenylacetate-CoA ligase